MSTYKCPECGSPINATERHCPNCDYDVTPAEYNTLVGNHTPAPTSTPTPAPTNNNIATSTSGVEAIMSHGNVDASTHHSDDHSTHNIDNSQTVNTTNQTVTNTFIIMGGGGAPIPQNIDPQTAEALKQVQQMQQPAQPVQPVQPAAQPSQTDEAHKGVGSIDGRRGAGGTEPKKNKTWIIIAAIAVIAVVAVLVLRPTHEEIDTTPAPVEQTSVPTKQTAPTTSKRTTTATSSAKPTTTKATANSTTKPQATNAVATAKPKQPTLAEMTSDQAYAAGMQYVNQGNWAQALKHLEKAANANHADAAFQLGEMYFGGIGVDTNKETAIRWYKVAANAGHKQAKRKLF